VFSEVARRKPGSVEPGVKESPGGPGEVVPLAVCDWPWRLADQHHSGLVEQPGPDRVGVRQIARHLTRPTRDNLRRERFEARCLTLV
jgi:hypothetical protein